VRTEIGLISMIFNSIFLLKKLQTDTVAHVVACMTYLCLCSSLSIHFLREVVCWLLVYVRAQCNLQDGTGLYSTVFEQAYVRK
jgi:hypothetical protein